MKMQAQNDMVKHPLRRVEVNIGRAIKVLEIDLSRLEKHRTNIEKYKNRGDARSLNDEQLNASRTVQQLKANVKQLEQLRLQVRDEDVSKFDDKTEDIRERTASVLSQFVHVTQGTGGAVPENSTDHDVIDNTSGVPEEDSSMEQAQSQLDTESNAQIEQSFQQLEHNLVELSELMHDFSSLVHDQKEKVDRIEDNVEDAAENVNKGASSLAKAAKYKAALYPITGALVGTLVGGPVGLMAGLKIGALAAVGGSVAGFTGGKLWQRKQTTQVENDESNRLSQDTSSHSDRVCNSKRDSTSLLSNGSVQDNPRGSMSVSYCCNEKTVSFS